MQIKSCKHAKLVLKDGIQPEHVGLVAADDRTRAKHWFKLRAVCSSTQATRTVGDWNSLQPSVPCGGIKVYSRKWLESLEEVVNKDTDKEASVSASVFIIADCWNSQPQHPSRRSCPESRVTGLQRWENCLLLYSQKYGNMTFTFLIQTKNNGCSCCSQWVDLSEDI